MLSLNNKPVIIIGSGGHAKVCIDLLQKLGRTVVGVVSQDRVVKSVLGVPVLGDNDHIYEYKPDDIELVNGVGFLPGRLARRELFDKFKSLSYVFSTLIHPSAVIAGGVCIKEGAQVMAGVVIQASTVIGKNCIVNTRASVDHDCDIADHCHLAPGVTLCGSVSVGLATFIGVGSVVSNGLTIGQDVTIAAGKTVIKSVADCGRLIKESV